MRRKIDVLGRVARSSHNASLEQENGRQLSEKISKKGAKNSKNDARKNIEKMQKITENQARNHVAVEMRVHLDKMCFHGSPKMDQAAPKASRGRPGNTPEHAWNVPGVSLERPKRILGALRHPLERSKGAPERLGGDLGRKMA